MGLIEFPRQRNGPKWTSRAVSRGGFPTTDDDTDRDHEIFNARLGTPMVALQLNVDKGRWGWGSGVRWKVGPLLAPIWIEAIWRSASPIPDRAGF